MGANLSLTDILAKIAKNFDFAKSAGTNLGSNEKLLKCFISNGEKKGDSIVLTDASGDNYKVSQQNIKNILTDTEFKALMDEGQTNGKTVETDEIIEIGYIAPVDKTKETADVSNVEATGSSDEIQKKIDALKDQKAANQEIMTSLQTQIEELKTKVEASIAEALNAIEDAKDDQKETAAKITANKIDDFKNRVKNGEKLSPTDLSQNVANAIAAEGLPISYQNAVSKLLFADTNTQIMNSLLGQLGDRIQIDKDIDSQIGSQEEALDQAKEAEAAAAAAATKSCDPIGFQKDGFQFDFIYDKDGDGKINSMDDFVGAKTDKAVQNGSDEKDGFDEIGNLDGNGGIADGKIDADELNQAGMKVVVTDKDGNKEVINMKQFEERFGKIEIQKEDFEKGDNGFVDGVGPKNFNDDKGNELLSSFKLSVGGETIDGYQTRDTENWLVKNYANVMDTDDIEAAKDAQTIGEKAELTEFEEFVNNYKDNVMPQLQKQVEEAYDKLGGLGFTGEFKNSLKQLAATSAQAEGSKIKLENEAKEKKAVEEAEKAEKVKTKDAVDTKDGKDEADVDDETDVEDDIGAQDKGIDDFIETPEFGQIKEWMPQIEFGI